MHTCRHTHIHTHQPMNKCLAYIHFLLVTLKAILNIAITQEYYKEQELGTLDFVLLLWLWIKALTNLDGVLKSRDITLLTEVHIVKAMVFLVVMYKCESWIIKKAECWRNDTFQLWSGEDSWESPDLQGEHTSQSERKSTLNIHWKD